MTAGSRTEHNRRWITPPLWLIAATIVLTLLMLYMAVAETSFRGHFFIDKGEYVALLGLAFVSIAAAVLYLKQRLASSLPLFLPWFFYPLITQGDQLIDNMTINQMRVVVHLLLGVIFAAPVVVFVLTAVYLLSGATDGRTRWWTVLIPGLRHIERGRTRDGVVQLSLAILLVEFWVAHQYLGSLMIATLAVMGLGLLYFGSVAPTTSPAPVERGFRNERLALGVVVSCVALSLVGYGYYKNLPTSQQGGVGPGRLVEDGGYAFDGPIVASAVSGVPDGVREPVREILNMYASALQGLFDGYYLLDRNYNYWFHNELFVRNTPVRPGFRTEALAGIEQMRVRAGDASARLDQVRDELPPGTRAFLEEIRLFADHHFSRATEWEVLSAAFEQTRAGLQHATHLYEGKNKALGQELAALVAKHQAAIETTELADLSREFVQTSLGIHQAYENRIVGF